MVDVADERQCFGPAGGRIDAVGHDSRGGFGSIGNLRRERQGK